MQINDLSFYSTWAGTDPFTLKPDFARKNEARWVEDSLPEVGRRTLEYTKRDPVKGSPFTMHEFRIGMPVLKGIVTDPEGPYSPVPVLDFAPPAKFQVWTHERDTEEQRIARCTWIALASSGSIMQLLLQDLVVKGRSLY